MRSHTDTTLHIVGVIPSDDGSYTLLIHCDDAGETLVVPNMERVFAEQVIDLKEELGVENSSSMPDFCESSSNYCEEES
jgi:hypothetical protein